MLALAGSGAAQGIRTNGAPIANMNGCNVMSNTAAQCNGSDLGAGFGLAHGTSSGCGVTPVSNVPAVADPYISRASNIPPIDPSKCPAGTSSYPQESKHGNSYSVAATNQLSGSLSLSAGKNFKCGDHMLTAAQLITTPLSNPAVLILQNGH